MGGLVEADLTIWTLAEDAVEDEIGVPTQHMLRGVRARWKMPRTAPAISGS